MADSDHSGEAASDEDPQADMDVKIAQIWAIQCGKTVWYPDTQHVAGTCFFKVSKHDRVLTRLTMGKTMSRHKSKGVVSMANRQIWRDLYMARKEACNAAYAKVQRDAMLQAGEDIPPNHKVLDARPGDEYFIPGRVVHVDIADQRCKLLFQVKGDVWVELSVKAVEAVIKAISESPVIEPASPKRRRRKKRRASATPKRDEREDHQEEPNEDAEREEHVD